MNLFSKLPFLKDRDNESTADELAEDRKARIQFHREKVRNGPVRWRPQTSGQFRREQKREIVRDQKKNFRLEKQRHWDGKRELAVLRAHLQGARILPMVHQPYPSQQFSLNSVTWIVQHFAKPKDETGVIVVDEPTVLAAIQSAFDRYLQIQGQPSTKIPETYVLPVAVAA